MLKLQHYRGAVEGVAGGKVGRSHHQGGLVHPGTLHHKVSGPHQYGTALSVRIVVGSMEDELTFREIQYRPGGRIVDGSGAYRCLVSLYHGLPVGLAVIGHGAVIHHVVNRITKLKGIGRHALAVIETGIGIIQEHFIAAVEPVVPGLASGLAVIRRGREYKSQRNLPHVSLGGDGQDNDLSGGTVLPGRRGRNRQIAVGKGDDPALRGADYGIRNLGKHRRKHLGLTKMDCLSLLEPLDLKEEGIEYRYLYRTSVLKGKRHFRRRCVIHYILEKRGGSGHGSSVGGADRLTCRISHSLPGGTAVHGHLPETVGRYPYLRRGPVVVSHRCGTANQVESGSPVHRDYPASVLVHTDYRDNCSGILPEGYLDGCPVAEFQLITMLDTLVAHDDYIPFPEEFSGSYGIGIGRCHRILQLVEACRKLVHAVLQRGGVNAGKHRAKHRRSREE